MEHPHSLLMLVLKQHYSNNPSILETAQKIIDDYKMDPNPNYEQTLGLLYQMMNDLPPDILLYFLTLVPLPAGPMTKTSNLVELMKQMHAINLLNNIRPTLLQYLNGELPPPLASVQKGSAIKSTETPEVKEKLEVKTEETPSKVTSVIDENIKAEKANRYKKKAKPKPKVTKKKYQVKPLTLMGALNVIQNEKIMKKKYEELKKEALNRVNSKNMTTEGINQCFEVIKDVNKKLRWLKMVKNADVTKEILEDQYGNSDIFYQEKCIRGIISEDVMELNDTLKKGIDDYLKRS